uniref:Uncharacterized protein n=1 Tax=Strongyloides venezuelensis TaxID=75913 RepID=A0A0K0FDE1_STRVS
MKTVDIETLKGLIKSPSGETIFSIYYKNQKFRDAIEAAREIHHCGKHFIQQVKSKYSINSEVRINERNLVDSTRKRLSRNSDRENRRIKRSCDYSLENIDNLCHNFFIDEREKNNLSSLVDFLNNINNEKQFHQLKNFYSISKAVSEKIDVLFQINIERKSEIIITANLLSNMH